MNDLTIVCPTHGRPGRVTAFGAFGEELLLCVAESQAPAYRHAYPDARIDVHPDTVLGLGMKMSWMYAKYGAFFRSDDDARWMICHDDSTRVDPHVACDVVRRLADTAEQMGLYLFGLSGEVIPMRYQPQHPYRLVGMVDGARCGLLPGSHLFWPDDIMVADVWAAALNAHFHRAVLVDQRYALDVTTKNTVGGLSKDRTNAIVLKKAELLVDSFGDAIERKGDYRYPWRLRVPW